MSNRKKHEEIHDQQELCDCCASWVFDVCHYKEAKSGHDLEQPHKPFTKDMLTDRSITICESCVEDAANDLDLEFCDDVLPPDTFHKLWEWVKLETVLNFIGWEDEPKNIEDVAEFFDALCGLMSWHPDDSFDQYVYNSQGLVGVPAAERRIFTDAQAEALDKIMANCFEICDKAGKEIYEMGLEAMRRAGQAPEPEPGPAETPTPTASSESPKQLVEHTDAQIEMLYALVDDAARLLADDVNEDCAAWHAKLTDVLAPDFRYRPAQTQEEEDSKVMVAISALARIKHYTTVGNENDALILQSIATTALDKIIPSTQSLLNMKYTVILMYPDYATEQYGETWCATVEAPNVDEAIKLAQAECAKGCEVERPEDIKPVSIFEGDHPDKINQWSEIR